MADAWAEFKDAPADPWAEFKDAPAAPKRKSTSAGGLAKSAATGVAKGVQGLAEFAEGLTPVGIARNTLNTFGANIESPMAPYRNMLNTYGHKPETRGERYAEAVGEQVPNALAPGGLVRRAASVILPGLAGEGAREAAEAAGAGKAGQGVAKFVGGFAGGLGASAQTGRRIAVSADEKAMNAFARRAKADPVEMRAKANALTDAGVQPSLIDVAGDRGRRIVRAVGVKSEMAGERLADNARKVSSSAKPDIMSRTRAIGPMRGKTATQAEKFLEAARERRAQSDYRGPYAAKVPIGDNLRDVLTDGPGLTALRQARADALERRDMAGVAEIDGFLAKQQTPDGVNKMPDAASPEAPAHTEDPSGGSLLTFLRQQGGLKDPGGELSKMDLGRSYGQFQKDNIINPKGISLEEAAHRAWEAGYFPHAKTGDEYHPVDEQMLLDEIRKIVRGDKPSGAWIGEEDRAAQNRWMDDAEDTLPPTDDAYWASMDEGAPTLSGSTLHRAMIAFRERGDKLARAGNRARGGGAKMRSGMVNQALNDVPEFAPAQAAYKVRSQALGVLGKDRKDVFSTDPADYGRWLQSLPAKARDANKVAIRQEVLDTLGGQRSSTFGSVDELATSDYAKANLQRALGPDAKPYLAFLEAKLEQVRNARMVDPNAGSRTAVLENDLGGVMRGAADVGGKALRGDIGGLAVKAATWLASRGISEQQARVMAEASVDPKKLPQVLSYLERRMGRNAAQEFLQAVRRPAIAGAASGAIALSGSQ